jgi:hypothetical protein
MIQKTLSLLTSIAIVALSSSSALAFSLIGSELGFRLETQRTPTSTLLVNRSPISAIVSESAVEFPNVQSLFNPRDFPGFSTVNATVDVGADYLEFDYAKAGSGIFSNTFKNDYVFTFTAPIALQITEVSIDPRTTLRLTPEKVTFAGNELFVNVSGLFFNSNSFARINLTTVAVSDPDTNPNDPAAVPEPSALLGMALAGSGLAYSKRRRFA